MSNKPKTGIILLNMGGPETPEDVAPFLYNLFSDREIIQLGPRLLQKPLAWLIARKRAPKSRATYAQIGGGSPLLSITARQAMELEKTLQDNGIFHVTMAMRYCRPMADEALELMASKGVNQIVALPLYPHFCRATSGSSLNDLARAFRRLKGTSAPKLLEIHGWADNHLYINSLAEKIRAAKSLFQGEMPTVVYSAHSLPTSFIEAGDPYVEELHKTIGAVGKLTGMQGHLCFQSRSGPVEWLSPSTPEMLQQLSGKGCKNVLMVPISFVSDHVETLYEINILYRQMAEEMGMTLHPSESLNTSPLFIEALRDLVLKAISSH